MVIKEVQFLKSSNSLKDCPRNEFPEFAFTGRSNVGKSSLINMLTGRKSLAKTSSTPGKTKLINFFTLNNSFYLVDMPGYGYAKVSKRDRNQFGKLIESYCLKRTMLFNLFILVDSNIPPQASDLSFIRWLGENQVPFSIIYTKTDKPSRKKLQSNLKEFKKQLEAEWEILPREFYTSSQKAEGKEEILEYIGDILSGSGRIH